MELGLVRYLQVQVFLGPLRRKGHLEEYEYDFHSGLQLVEVGVIGKCQREVVLDGFQKGVEPIK